MSFEEINITRLKDLDLLTLRELYCKFNEQSPNDCSANKMCYNDDDELFAIRCNCGKKIYHPVVNNQVIWFQKISPQNLSKLKKLSLEKALAILED